MPLFRKQSAAMLPSLTPHDSKARLIVVTIRGDSWRSHVHRTRTAQRVQSFKLQTANVRGQGARPLAFSWGSKGDILSRERISPLSRAAPPALPFPLRCAQKAKKEGRAFAQPPSYAGLAAAAVIAATAIVAAAATAAAAAGEDQDDEDQDPQAAAAAKTTVIIAHKTNPL